MLAYFFLFKIEINKIKPVAVIIEDIIKNTLITNLNISTCIYFFHFPFYLFAFNY